MEILSLSNPKYWQITKYCKGTYEKPDIFDIFELETGRIFLDI